MSSNVKGHVLFNYSAQDDDEISLFKGECVFILETYDDDWWMVKKGDLVGLAPSNYLRVNAVDHSKIEDAELPPGWKSAIDNESNDIYYYNEDTGLVQWENPSLPLSHTNRSTELESRLNKAPIAAAPSQSSNGIKSNSDLKRLQALRVQAERKINDLKAAVANHENAGAQKISARLHSASLEEQPLNTNSQFLPCSEEKRWKASTQKELRKNSSEPQISRPGPSSLDFMNILPELSDAQPSNVNDDRQASNQVKLPVLVDAAGHEHGQEKHHHHKDYKKIHSKVDSNNHVPHSSPHSHQPHQPHHPHHPPSQQSPSKPQHQNQHPDQGDLPGAGFHYPHCRSQIFSPTWADSVPSPPSAPSCRLELKHVFGYEGNPCRHGTTARGKNVIFIDDRCIMFPAAALVVVMDTLNERRQWFFCGHTEDVLCLASHPDRTIAASGQVGKGGMILVWNTSSIRMGGKRASRDKESIEGMENTPYERVDGRSSFKAMIELKTLPGIRAVCGLNFSGGDGDLLVALGIDESHLAMIYNWKSRTLIASAKIGQTDVRQIAFNPYLFHSYRKDMKHMKDMKDMKDIVDEGSRSSERGSSESGSPQKHKRQDAPISPSAHHLLGCFTLISYGGKHIKFWTLQPYVQSQEDPLEKLSGFKGRQLAHHHQDEKYIQYKLEGSLGTSLNKSATTANLEFTCMVMSDDRTTSYNIQPHEKSRIQPQSRIFCGTSTGDIYIWHQISANKTENEGDEEESSDDPQTPYMPPSWLPRGQLLSVITGAHDSPLVDLDYIRGPARGGLIGRRRGG